MTIGDNIKRLRKARGLTLDDLAKVIQTSRQTVSRYENNIITNIPADKVEKIARALDTTPADLFDWDTNESGLKPYYLDPEVARRAEELRTNSGMRILFDASRDLSPDDLDVVLNVVEGLKKRHK